MRPDPPILNAQTLPAAAIRRSRAYRRPQNRLPMIFSDANIISGDRFHVGYNEQNWQLTARVVLRWQLAGEDEAQQMVAYSNVADATALGGFRWIFER